MPYIEKDIEKKYFNIGEVAKLLNVNSSLIRFWEEKFDLINPKKNKKGKRKYTNKDIDIIKNIYSLVKKKGFTLNGANEKINREAKSKPDQKHEILNSLNKIKKSMKNLRDTI